MTDQGSARMDAVSVVAELAGGEAAEGGQNMDDDRALMTQYLQEYPPAKGYITRREVAQNCAECLNVKGNGTRTGWDCLVPECTWYRRMPWRGREMPKRLQPRDALRERSVCSPQGVADGPETR